MREEISQKQKSEGKSESLGTAIDRLERRRLIRAAVASVPVVLTFSAGTAHAQDASVMESGVVSDAPDDLDDLESGDSEAVEEDESGPLTPAEELETFGLERIERPESYSEEDPYRNLDSIHPEVDFDSP